MAGKKPEISCIGTVFFLPFKPTGGQRSMMLEEEELPFSIDNFTFLSLEVVSIRAYKLVTIYVETLRTLNQRRESLLTLNAQ